MKKGLLILLALVVCMPSFAKKHHKNKKQKTTSGIVSVAYRHTGCFGKCRDYAIEVNASGMATYTATRFNADSGIFVKSIGKAEATALIGKFEAYHVDTCKDLYESRIPDLPGTMFTIRYTNKTKTIRDAKYAPIYLQQLGLEMDKLVGEKADETWKRKK